MEIFWNKPDIQIIEPRNVLNAIQEFVLHLLILDHLIHERFPDDLRLLPGGLEHLLLDKILLER